VQKLLAIIASLLPLAAGGVCAQEPLSGYAVVGADVLTMADGGRLQDQTVLISGDRIQDIGPRSATAVPPGYAVVDGAGRTLMPGLVDMHVHLAPTPAAPGDPAQRALAVMLAHGVTTARTMAGAPVHLEVRSRIEAGELAGPRLYVAAPSLHLGNTSTPEAARAAVQAARAAGYDLIKSHHLEDVAVWEAVQDEAKSQGMSTAGHVANGVGLDRALRAGQQVEHLDGVILELLPTDAPARQIDFAQIPPPQVLDAAGAVQDRRIAEVAEGVAAAGGYHVPTLSLFEKIARTDVADDVLAGAPEMRFVPDPAVQQWRQQRQQMRDAGFTPDLGQGFVDLRRRIVRAFHEAGVPLMAGSDTAQSFHVWGPGLVQEVEALSAAGLGDMAALKAATAIPRDYFRSLPNQGSALGWEADFGVVAPGARADLILIDGDPSRDLGDLRRLQAVFAGGRHYDRAALDRLLAEAEQAAKAVQ
jgi:cytosine/adenosine deaminase-related metal-dependent hydrolase